jgi:hypothetical protein
MASPRLSVRNHEPNFVESVQSALDSLRALAPNWDGYGAPMIDPVVIDAAKAFVAGLPENLVSPPCVVPMANGTLQLEWHHGPKSLELEFESALSIRYLRWHPEQGIEEEDSFLVNKVEFAVDLMRWFGAGVNE